MRQHHGSDVTDIIGTETANLQHFGATVEAAPLKIPVTDAGETSGICNLRPRPISLEDIESFVTMQMP